MIIHQECVVTHLKYFKMLKKAKGFLLRLKCYQIWAEDIKDKLILG